MDFCHYYGVIYGYVGGASLLSLYPPDVLKDAIMG